MLKSEILGGGCQKYDYDKTSDYLDFIESYTYEGLAEKLAHQLDMTVVCEGIETKRQSDIVIKNKCDYIQGYYYSKPMSVEEYEVFMENRSTADVRTLIQEIQNRYGSHLKVLDWALHMDEETPHIHERHVFFADDGYGMDFPKQDKALEALGFERPDPEKKQSKINNRKMVFDAEIRELFIELAEKHGITIERIPLEGKTHLEKNDFILSKQREEMVANEAYIEDQLLRMSDIDAMAEDIADKAYEKACEVITDTVKETTIEEDINIVNDYKKSLTERNNGLNDGQKNLIKKVLNNVIQRLTRNTSILIEKVKGILANPEIKRKNKDEIAKVARESIFEKLERAKKESDEHNASRQISHKQNCKEGRDR